MKFLEKFALTVYSYIVLVLAVIMCLLVFNWIDIGTVTKTVTTIAQGDISSKITLVISAIFILLSIKCIFFDSTSKEQIKERQGVLLENESGKLMISKETIENLVRGIAKGFEGTENVTTKVELDKENNLRVQVTLYVHPNAIIKDLSANIQTRIKEAIKSTSDLEVHEVNIRIRNIVPENQGNVAE